MCASFLTEVFAYLMFQLLNTYYCGLALLVLFVDGDNQLPEVRAYGRMFDEVSIHCEYIVTSGVVTNSRVDTTAE